MTAQDRRAPARLRTPGTGDLVFAAVLLFVVGLPSFVFGVADIFGMGDVVIAALASLLMPIALAWRRVNPVASSVIVYAAALAHFVAGTPLIFADFLIFIALYSASVYGPRWARRAALVSALFGCFMQGVLLALMADPFSSSSLVAGMTAFFFLGALTLCTWALALARRGRVERLETLAERAARLERERDAQAQIATAAERARIAREMHDIVAHSLSVVIAQADGGRYAAATDPVAAERALATISESGRAALADMRRILGVLRSEDAEAADLIPQPADTDLDQLVAHVREAGLPVSLVRMGTPRPLPPGTGLAIYRIAQESLTNVLKHAGPRSQATVLLQWTPTHLVLAIDDDGRGAAAGQDGHAPGHGLVGMRERATMLGGTLTAGARTGGGWRVRTEIPLPPAPAGSPTIPMEHTS